MEFTLVLPVLVSLMLGTIFFGYDFYTYNRLEESVRSGARFASTHVYDVLHGADPTPGCASCTGVIIDAQQSAFARAVQNVTVYGTESPAQDSVPLVEGLTADQVQVLMDVTNNIPTAVGVRINGYQLRTPVGTITLTKPVTMFYYPAQALYKIPG